MMTFFEFIQWCFRTGWTSLLSVIVLLFLLQALTIITEHIASVFRKS